MPLPSEAELQILATIWTLRSEHRPRSHDALGTANGVLTTLKQMQLMTSKGLLVRNERFRSHVYDAAQPKEHTQANIAADLLKRAFDNSTPSLVLGMLSAKAGVNRATSQKIRQLLRDFEKRKGSQ